MNENIPPKGSQHVKDDLSQRQIQLPFWKSLLLPFGIIASPVSKLCKS
jgi:hypothetical protein